MVKGKYSTSDKMILSSSVSLPKVFFLLVVFLLFSPSLSNEGNSEPKNQLESNREKDLPFREQQQCDQKYPNKSILFDLRLCFKIYSGSI